MSEKRQKILMIIISILMLLSVSGLSARLVILQAYRSDEKLARLADSRRFERRLIVGRGKILDRNNNILVMDLVNAELCADPKLIAQSSGLKSVAEALALATGLDETEMTRRLNANADKRFMYVMGYGNYVGADVMDAIRSQKPPGVWLNDTMVRSHTMGSIMSQTLGFVNLNGDGTYGIEQQFDSYLKGTPGLIESEVDGRRRELYNRRIRQIMPRPGADVHLTIDQFVQYLTEQALIEGIEEQRAVSGWAIIQKVRTGEILAMASYPGFDPGDFRNADIENFRNSCISYTFEPGSTFKIAVIAAALNEGVVTPDQMFDCENGAWYYGGRPLHDYHPYGKLSVADIIKKSSNIGAAKVALALGNRRLFTYLRAFGTGRKTGIELPGEESGLLRPPDKWSAISATRIAMGHEVAVTALQMLNMMCTIANDGKLMKPYIVDRVVDRNGDVLLQNSPQILGNPVTPKTAAIMRRLLSRTTEQGGTGQHARIDGYKVAGKTGTAQKPIPGGYSDKMNMASFVGFVPADNPVLSMIVVLDSPMKTRTGGAAAAPVFKKVMQQVLRYFDVPETDVQLARR